MSLILSENRRLKFANFVLLYFLQGWIAGFTGTAIVNELAARGTKVGVIGRFVFIIGLPWIIQFIWSPLVDRYPNFAMGKRRTWLVGALIPANIVLLALFFVPFDPFWLSAVFLAHAFLCSIMDVAVDGLMIDLVGESEMGLASSLTNGGSVIGGCLSGLIFSWTLTNWSFSTNVTLLLAISLMVTAFALCTRERREDSLLSLAKTSTASRRRLPFRKIAYLVSCRMSRTNAVVVMILSFLIFFGFSVTALTFNAELVQKGGWSSFELSRLQSMLGLISGTAGAFLMGKLVDRYGYRLVLAGAFFLMAGFFSLMAIAPSQWTTLYITVLTVAPGFIFVSMVPGVMEVSRGAVAATSFTLCMTLMNFGGLAGSTISDFVFATISRSGVFAIESGLFLGALALVIVSTERFAPKAQTYPSAVPMNAAANPV